MADIGRSRYFADRDDAAHHLAVELAGYRGQQVLVLAIPRGGVPLGRIIADRLEGELWFLTVFHSPLAQTHRQPVPRDPAACPG